MHLLAWPVWARFTDKKKFRCQSTYRLERKCQNFHGASERSGPIFLLNIQRGLKYSCSPHIQRGGYLSAKKM